MFLLFQFLQMRSENGFRYLHSNMFLLFLRNVSFEDGAINFTFQYVSIISLFLPSLCKSQNRTLHSNMFLLFLSKAGVPSSTITLYIPICFYYFLMAHYTREHGRKSLHSNMFLLFRSGNSKYFISDHHFTFQYVSIISPAVAILLVYYMNFTFQYVSLLFRYIANM